MERTVDRNGDAAGRWPSVTLVFLVYNRREELRESLRNMLDRSDYEGHVEVIVVDNASADGSAEMVREEFPDVRLIVRDENVGVSGWNVGFAAATTDWVLALDDDCYLSPDGLRRAIEAARAHEADLVSFRVVSTHDPDYVFSEINYRTGLFTFWGCAVLLRRPVVQELGGYDPEIFVWANELEFMVRFFDRGYRHLHLPEVVAHHMKRPPDESPDAPVDWRPYRLNARHWAYIAGSRFRARDAAEAFVALVARVLRDAAREEPGALGAVPETVKGFVHGLRHRRPVKKPEVSRFYRRNFETFASPWWLARPPGELIRSLPREIRDGRRAPKTAGRRAQYFEERSRYYPDEAATLQF